MTGYRNHLTIFWLCLEIPWTNLWILFRGFAWIDAEVVGGWPLNPGLPSESTAEQEGRWLGLWYDAQSAPGIGKVLCVCSLQPEMPGNPTPKVFWKWLDPCAARGKKWRSDDNPEWGWMPGPPGPRNLDQVNEIASEPFTLLCSTIVELAKIIYP